MNRQAAPVQNERLLTPKDTASRLGISRAMFYRIAGKLRGQGLKQVTLPSVNGTRPVVRYTASSLDRIIDKAVRREAPIC